MIDVSAPLMAGDSISFTLEGETRSEKIVEAFWQERPKGGKEYCYKTESGCVVPLSKVVSADPALNIKPYEDTEPLKLDKDLLLSIVEAMDLDERKQKVIKFILGDDREDYELARFYTTSLILDKAISSKMNFED